jgi:hypothetical protein
MTKKIRKKANSMEDRYKSILGDISHVIDALGDRRPVP